MLLRPDWEALLPPHPAALLPVTQAEVAVWRSRYAERYADGIGSALPAEAFPYQDLPPTTRLTYEQVSWQNVGQYLLLFADDPSSFVDVRFKTRETLEAYAVALLLTLRVARKWGAIDWLLRERRTGQPVGVLHLFELNAEQYPGSPPPCVVGYAVAAPHRRQGYASEALGHLLTQAAQVFGRREARALVAVGNTASEALLRKLGFGQLEEQAQESLWGRLLG